MAVTPKQTHLNCVACCPATLASPFFSLKALWSVKIPKFNKLNTLKADMNIVFLGAPGTGKGTYTRRVSETLNLATISTGELLRANRGHAKYGKEIAKYQDKGLPVPDEIVMPILKERLKQSDCKNGVVFDAMPYNLSQTEALDKIVKVDLVINLILPEDIIIEKTINRRVCSKCGDPAYNLSDIQDKKRQIFMPPLLPKVPGKCNTCGGDLIQRDDDTTEVVKKRLEVYNTRIEPVLKLYRNRGIVKDFKVNAVPDIMVPKLLELIDHSV